MSGRIIFGLGLVVFGLGFLLDQLGVFDFGDLLDVWWPLGLIFIGVVQLATSGSYFWGVIFLVAGIAFQVTELEILPVSLGPLLWPLALIAIGVWLVVSRYLRPGLPAASPEDRLNAFIAFGGINPRNNSSSFQGGNVTALFGGAEVDLRDAKLASEGGNLELTVAFGGVEVFVPEDWQVKMSGVPIFGGWEDNTRRSGESDPLAPTLNVSAFVAFGGAEVKN